MKKALTKALLIVMTIVTLATVMPISANASTSNAQKIYNFLTQTLDFNSAAACGILANIERESDFNPKLVIRDSNGLTSGGLCQWNGTRFRNLKNYCSENGYDYLSIEGQLRYLDYELQKKTYKHIYDYLMNVSNDADGAYDAGYYWCYYFEIPRNRSVKAKQRGTMAEKDYWPVYGESIPEKPVLSFKEDTQIYDLNTDIRISWTSAGGACTLYRVYVVRKDLSTNTYDWENVRAASSKTTSYTIPAFTLQKGSYYAILVRAYNTATMQYTNSNYIFCYIGCDHDYTSEIVREATFENRGLETLTCEKCGEMKTVVIPVVTADDFVATVTTTPEVTAASHSAVRIKWDPTPYASGYGIYIREGNVWTLLKTIKADDELTYLYTGLDEATEYKFCVRAYLRHDGEFYMNTPSPTLLTSTETTVPVISEVDGQKGSYTVSWDHVDGADGYQIYVATGNSSYTRAATVPADFDSYVVSPLIKGQSYKFVVRSFIRCSNGTYVYSNCSSAETVIAG